MINRDNLSVETDNYQCAISVSKNQMPFAEDMIDQITSEIPGIRFDVPSRWSYHNGGYYYKEIHIGHAHPGRAFETMNQIEEVIRRIALR